LNFDNHFWLEFMPQRFAQERGLEVDIAKAELFGRYQAVQGSLNWYCLDYWSSELELDIVALKREVADLIAVHEHVWEFLEAVSRSERRLVLVTNAHRRSAELKFEHTGIDVHFDRVICSHELGEAKENPRFWQKLAQVEPYHPAETLMVDDNLDVLRAAEHHGIQHLIAVRYPDTTRPANQVEEFAAIDDFRQLIVGLE
jgi:putative hydrolase of the HAD superfamily